MKFLKECWAEAKKLKKLAITTSTLTFLLLLPMPAHAWFWAVVTWVGTALGIGAVAATALTIGAAIIGAVIIAKKFKESMSPDLPDFAETGSKGILINKTGSSNNIPVIFGSTRTGGTRVLTETNGTDNDFLHAIYVVGEGLMEQCTAIYFDGVKVATSTTTGDSSGTNWTILSPYDATLVQIWFRAGSDSATALTEITDLKSWSGSPHFKGIAYVYLKLKYDEDKWKNGLPTVTFDVKGVKVPSTTDGTTMAYSENPANVILSYLTNTRYGKGIPVADIDLPSFETARLYCITKGWHTRGNLVTNATMYSNLIDLLSSCRGYLALGSKYKLLLDSPNTMTPFPITKDNTIGNIEYILADKKTMFNKMTAKFLNETTEYKDDTRTMSSTTLQTQDNGLILDMEVAYPYTKTHTTAIQLLTEEINQSRQSHTISLTTTVAGIDLEVGDICSVTNETFGITEKKFRVMATEIKASSEVDLVLKEYDANVYGTEIITNAKDDNND